MYNDNSTLYKSFKLMDRFKLPLSEIKTWTPLEVEAAEAYCFRHATDPTLHAAITKAGMFAALSNGAKIVPSEQYPEIERHFTMPDFLKSKEELDIEMQQEIERQRKLHEQCTAGLIDDETPKPKRKRKPKEPSKPSEPTQIEESKE
ncbi:hypothetical protein [Aeromonas veronii]|uniref:hypothetical protein n=1 Tax=Aeromonas veronii TaxID=654 RepID=UPI003BA3042A